MMGCFLYYFSKSDKQKVLDKYNLTFFKQKFVEIIEDCGQKFRQIQKKRNTDLENESEEHVFENFQKGDDLGQSVFKNLRLPNKSVDFRSKYTFNVSNSRKTGAK